MFVTIIKLPFVQHQKKLLFVYKYFQY